MSSRDILPPTFTASQAYEAAVQLGRNIKMVRGDATELQQDLERYVDKPYSNYGTYQVIRQGFLVGYGQARLAARLEKMAGQHFPKVAPTGNAISHRTSDE